MIMKKYPPPGVNKLYDKAVTGFDGTAETVNSSGIPVLSSFKHLSATTANWILGVHFPLDEAYAPMRKTKGFLLGGIMVGTLAMLTITWLVMRRLTGPLETVTRQVEAMAREPGAPRLLSCSATDEIGTLASAFNVMVTALDKKRAALLESENNFRSLAETASDGMLVITGSGSFVFCNYHAAKILGYSVEELLRCGISDLAYPEELSHLMERFHKVISWQKVPRQYETRLVRKDGAAIPVEITSSLTIWREQSADLVIFRDISERRRIEKALLDAYNLLQQTFASLNEAVFIVRTDTRIIQDCNIIVEKMFGYSRDEMIGVTTSILHVTEEMSERFGREMLKGYAGKGFFETVFKMKRKDGTVFDSEHFVSPIRDADGEVFSHVCVVRDISERRHAEEDIRSLNRDLQQQTVELAAANRELESFGYSLSHDLKGPLTTIYCAAQGLMDLYGKQLDETGKFFLDGICKGSERMDELIDAMFLLSKISRSELCHAAVDLSLLATQIMLGLRMEDLNRKVDSVIMPGIIAMCDQSLLKSALENLLGNAWKYTRNEPVACIEFGRSEHAGEPVYFVRDNGVGFDMKDADKLFKPFQRLHHSSKFEGTGIGLATVQRIIERHGGKLWGEGEPGRGATFYFTLPDKS
jgi:PAS domain S-box-containing protein